MLVLSVAYPLFPVNQDSSGGAEQILYLLERGLVQAGHQSLVVAAQGSQVSGSLHPTQAAGTTISETDHALAQQAHKTAIRNLLARYPIDIVHFHGLDFPTYLPQSDVPRVATLHLPPSWYEPSIFALKTLKLVCVSQSQAASVPHPDCVTVIPNGVEKIDADPMLARTETLLWLGRICPEKGTHIALRVAHELDAPLTVAGPVHGFDTHLEYFRREVQPLLDDRRRYIGPVGRAAKRRLLQKAKALLIPSLAPETSSLVALEAINARTPIVAFAAGALPEVVANGDTGFVVASEAEMAAAVSRLSELRLSMDGSGPERMVTTYINLYERMIRTRHF